MSTNVSFIIINRNTEELLQQCISNLIKVCPFDNEIIVIDNNSSDNSTSIIKEKFPSITLIENQFNRGFASAVNQGLEASQNAVVFVVNTDAFPLPGAIEKLYDAVISNTDCAMAGPALLNTDQSPQNSIESFPYLLGECINKSLLKKLFPSKIHSKNKAPTSISPVETIVGAFMCIKRKAIAAIGNFNSNYFFFFEETDLCKRIRSDLNMNVLFVPEAKVIHLQGKTISSIKHYARVEYHRSLYLYFKQHYGISSLMLLLPARFIKAIIGMLLNLPFSFYPSCRNKTFVYLWIVIWHIMLCPQGFGLKKTIPENMKKFKIGNKQTYLNKNIFNSFSEIESLINKATLPIKENRIKRIYRIKLNKQVFFIKEYRSKLKSIRAKYEGTMTFSLFFKMFRRFASSFFSFFTSKPKGLKEAELIFLAQRKNIPVIPPYGIVVEKKYGFFANKSFIIFPFLDDYVSLNEVCSSFKSKTSHLPQIATKLGQFARKIHNNGIFQDDLTFTNILIHKDINKIKFKLIDFERTEIRSKSLSLNEKIYSLVKLTRAYSASPMNKLRFLRAYLNQPINSPYAKHFSSSFVDLEKGVIQKDAVKIKRKCITPGRNFIFVDYPSPGCQGYIRNTSAIPNIVSTLNSIIDIKEILNSFSLRKPQIFTVSELESSNLIALFTFAAKDIWQSLNMIFFAGLPAVAPVGFFETASSISDAFGLILFLAPKQCKSFNLFINDKTPYTLKTRIITEAGYLLGAYHNRGFFSPHFDPNAILFDPETELALFSSFPSINFFPKLLFPNYAEDISHVLENIKYSPELKRLFITSYARRNPISSINKNELEKLIL